MVTKSDCQKALSRKIAINMKEYKAGKYSSRSQAIAVAYSQVRKKKPSCSRFFKRSKKSKRSKRSKRSKKSKRSKRSKK